MQQRYKKKILIGLIVVMIVLVFSAIISAIKIKEERQKNGGGEISSTQFSETGLVPIQEGINNIPIEEDMNFEYSFLKENLADYTSDFVGVVGYLYVPDTSIDFPVVQGEDNEYYLNTGYFGEPSNYGAPFVDYRNDIDLLDDNNVIYGHNMADGNMFGTLKNVLSKDYTDNSAYLYLNTEGYKNVFEIYSVYEIDLTTFNFIKTGFESESEKTAWLMQSQRLNQNGTLRDVVLSKDSKIITLSTCTQGGEKRLIVHASLLDRQVY